MNDDIKGDVLVISGNLKPEVKFASAERSRVNKDPESLINDNKFFPRILLAIVGDIGAGLDSLDVYAVYRAGFPTSILEMAQELGRCGRRCSNEDGIKTDEVHLLLTLDDFIYLNTILYYPHPSVPSITTPVLLPHEEITIQENNLLIFFKLIVLKGSYWHVQLESILGNPMDPPPTTIVNCNNTCPVCNGEIEDFIMPVKQTGLFNFLADSFINNPS